MSTTNGKQPDPDPELISAFYDAETTPEERAALEQSLSGSSESLQRLEDYEQLSSILRELHRVEPPTDLRSAVMSAVTQVDNAGELATSTVDASTRRRRVLSIAAGLSGLAAAVVLLLWPFGRVPPGDTVAMHHESQLVGESAPASGQLSVSNSAVVGEREVLAASKVNGEAASAAAFTARETEIAASNDEMEANIASSLSLQHLARERPLPAVGDVVGYLDRNADDLTWVAVTVADVQEAGGKVQMLLTRHGVESPAGSTPHLETSQTPGEQVTFVVEADWNQMEAVIVDLSEESFIQSVEVDAPADEGVPTELQNYAYHRGAGRSVNNGIDPAKELRQRVMDRQGLVPNPVPSDRDSELAEGLAAGAVQLQANVPDVELKRIAAKRAVEPRPESTPQLAADEKQNTRTAEAISDDRMLRAISARPRAKVLIVLQAK